MKSISYVFLTVLLLFITLLVVDLGRDSGSQQVPFADLASMKVDSQLPTALSIFIFSYTFQFMVFQSYVELENRTNWRMEQASMISQFIYSGALITTGITGVLLFGSSIKSDLLANIGSRSSGLSIFVRNLYAVLLMFHLPYIFFALKEYVLVMYDEVTSNTLTKHLEHKLKLHE